MKAIVFSSYVPTYESLVIGTDFLDMFETYFQDYDLYIGVNHGSIAEWENVLKKYSKRLNIFYGFVEKKLSIDSDVSGFQKALGLLRNSGKNYELIWFGHTKGATKNRDHIRKDIFENFLSKKEIIEKRFEDEKLGIVGRYITTNTDFIFIDNNLNKVNSFEFTSANIFYLYTFYVIRGSIVYRFLHTCDKHFFTENLLNYYSFDRYFFERDFPNIPTRYGYDFSYDIIRNHPIWNFNYKRKLKIFGKKRFQNNGRINLEIFFILLVNRIAYFVFRFIELLIAIKFLKNIKKYLIQYFYKVQ